MAVVYTSGEIVEGYVEWYDRSCIKLNRDNAPNLLIYKSSIRCIYKAAESPEEGSHPAGNDRRPHRGDRRGPGRHRARGRRQDPGRRLRAPTGRLRPLRPLPRRRGRGEAARTAARGSRLGARPDVRARGIRRRRRRAVRRAGRRSRHRGERGDLLPVFRDGRGGSPRRSARRPGDRPHLEGGLGPGRPSLPGAHRIPGRVLSRRRHDLLVGAAQGRPAEPSPAPSRGRRGRTQGRLVGPPPLASPGPRPAAGAARTACSRPG
ncbi:MAG: hypothetical protein MZU79_05320 [Anaerotruncus sp.]|nr:hypothetical protein [Anaerotruncus sp.]